MPRRLNNPRTQRPLLLLVGRDDTERVNIQIQYHGGWPRTHRVSVGFLRKLDAWIDKKSADIDWWLT